MVHFPLLYVPTLSYILVKESCSRMEKERNYYYLSEDSSLGLVLPRSERVRSKKSFSRSDRLPFQID